MNKLLLLSGAAALLLAGSAMAHGYNVAGSRVAAQTWQQQAAALQAQDSDATTPGGERLDIIASQPVPDTMANRDRYGPPDSMSGRLTRPIGD